MPSSATTSIFAGSGLLRAFGVVFVVLVVLACLSDVRRRRIPNGLTLVIALGGIAFSLVRLGVVQGAIAALTGIAVGLAIWIGFYAVGVMGAGDVKFFAAASAWLGPAASWRAALIAAGVGGVLAVLFLLRDSRLRTTVQRLALLPLSRSLDVTSVKEMTGSEAKRQLPYGVAMGIGLVVVAMFPGVLS